MLSKQIELDLFVTTTYTSTNEIGFIFTPETKTLLLQLRDID